MDDGAFNGESKVIPAIAELNTRISKTLKSPVSAGFLIDVAASIVIFLLIIGLTLVALPKLVGFILHSNYLMFATYI